MKRRKSLWYLIVTLIIVGIVMVIAITLTAASFGRYSLDFAWMFGLATILVLMHILEELKDNMLAKKIFTVLVGGLMIISIFVNALDSINSERNFFRMFNTKEYFELQSTICFWE